MWTNENRAHYDRSGLRYPSDVTDAEWELVSPLIPPARRGGGKRKVNMREVVNGLMYVLSCQWRAIPKDLPPKSTVYGYFDRPRLFLWPGRIRGRSPRRTSKGAEKMNPSTIGVDVSKDFLDAHRLADGDERRFANDKTGRKALIKWLSAAPVKRVVFEPTGPYHRAFERALDDAGLPSAKVNPRQARRFAEAAGKLVKTDRADAATLARMGEVLDLPPRPCVSQTIAELKELHLARAALLEDRTAAKNRAKAITLPLLEKQNKRFCRKLCLAVDLGMIAGNDSSGTAR